MKIDIIYDEKIDNDIIYIGCNDENYKIIKDYIGGTCIENYWLYGCYNENDYDYELFINSYSNFEDVLKEIKKRG